MELLRESPSGGPARSAPRVPFAPGVEVRFEDFDEFMSSCSGNLSMTGMFLETVRPHEPGSSLQFELAVEGGQRLIRGAGEVVWSRPRSEADERRPPGMGIRFVSLDANSRKLIRWLVERSPGPERTDQ